MEYKGTADIEIRIKTWISSEYYEKVEDRIKDVFTEMGIPFELEDKVTGNSVTN